MNIDMYLTVAFYMGMVAIVIRCGKLMFLEYPRKEETSVGIDVVCLIACIFFFVWVCFLKFN